MTEREALLEVPLANVKRFKTEKTVGTSLLSVEIPEAPVAANSCNISEEISEHRSFPLEEQRGVRIKEVPHDILTVEDASARGGDKKRIAVESDLSEAEALAPLKRIEVDIHSVLI